MIHLSEAIVGINKKPKAIGSDKTFGRLVTGDTIYIWVKAYNGRQEFTVTLNNLHPDGNWATRSMIVKPGDKPIHFDKSKMCCLSYVNNKIKQSGTMYLPKDESYAETRSSSDNDLFWIWSPDKKTFEQALKYYGL